MNLFLISLGTVPIEMSSVYSTFGTWALGILDASVLLEDLDALENLECREGLSASKALTDQG